MQINSKLFYLFRTNYTSVNHNIAIKQMNFILNRKIFSTNLDEHEDIRTFHCFLWKKSFLMLLQNKETPISLDLSI